MSEADWPVLMEPSCETLFMCIITTLKEGMRAGGGISDVLRKLAASVSQGCAHGFTQDVFCWGRGGGGGGGGGQRLNLVGFSSYPCVQNHRMLIPTAIMSFTGYLLL